MIFKKYNKKAFIYSVLTAFTSLILMSLVKVWTGATPELLMKICATAGIIGTTSVVLEIFWENL